MDLIKIGTYISKKRKNLNLTQAQLAKSLNVTDRAVSKWECGRSFPDQSILLNLCDILHISVNELLAGEDLTKIDIYNNQAEINLIRLTNEKYEADKKLLISETIIAILGTIIFLALIFTGIFTFIYANLPLWAMILMIVIGLLTFILLCLFSLKIEQKAGYYECKECGYKYVPSFISVLMAPHINRSRYMKCPKCGKKSYHKKVLK